MLIPAIRLGGIVGVAILSAAVAVVDFSIAAWLNNRVIGGGYWRVCPPSGADFSDLHHQRRHAYLLLPYIPAPHRLFPFFIASLVMILLYSLLSWMIDPIFRRIALGAMNRLGPTRRLAARLGA